MNTTHRLLDHGLLLWAVALLATSCTPDAASQSEPGKRPDMTPSGIEFWATLEGRTLEQIRAVKDAEQELEASRQRQTELTEKQSTAEEGPWWSPFADEKTKIGRELERLGERIKELERKVEVQGALLQDYLSSTPGGRTAPELELGEYRLNKEAIEIRNALENLQALGKRLVGDIKDNPRDTKKAVECYDAQLRALGYVQLMHQEFSRRCQEDYPKYLDDLEKATSKFIDKQRGVLAGFRGEPGDADIIHRTIEKAEKLAERLPALRGNVREMRRWSEQNLETVRNKKVVLASLRDSAALIDRAKDIANSVSSAFSELTFEEPPLVEFEFDADELDLEVAPPGGGIE